jgi:hypothetical protein
VRVCVGVAGGGGGGRERERADSSVTPRIVTGVTQHELNVQLHKRERFGVSQCHIRMWVMGTSRWRKNVRRFQDASSASSVGNQHSHVSYSTDCITCYLLARVLIGKVVG